MGKCDWKYVRCAVPIVRISNYFIKKSQKTVKTTFLHSENFVCSCRRRNNGSNRSNCSICRRRNFNRILYGSGGHIAIEQIVAVAHATFEFFAGCITFDPVKCECDRHQMATDLWFQCRRYHRTNQRVYRIQMESIRSQRCAGHLHHHMHPGQYRNVSFQGDSLEVPGRRCSFANANGWNGSNLFSGWISDGITVCDTACYRNVSICWHQINSFVVVQWYSAHELTSLQWTPECQCRSIHWQFNQKLIHSN